MDQNQKQFSESLYQFLSPLSLQYDAHIDSVAQSQDLLLEHIQKLQEKLHSCHEEANSFINIEPYLRRLTACRRNIESLGNDMRVIRERVHKMTVKSREMYPSVWKAREETLRRKNEDQQQQQEDQDEELTVNEETPAAGEKEDAEVSHQESAADKNSSEEEMNRDAQQKKENSADDAQKATTENKANE